MNTDPIADLLTRIRNAHRAHKNSVSIPHSTIKENICKVMSKHGFIGKVEVEGKGKDKAIIVHLLTDRETLTLKRVSKPGQRIYSSYKDIKPVVNHLGISIISTPKGIMADKEAKYQKLGGEIICEVY